MFIVYLLISVQRLDGGLDHAHPNVFSPVETQWGGASLGRHQWVTSTPERRDGEPVSFDGGRVRAWLGVHSPAPPERTTPCSKAVQTDAEEMVGGVSFSTFSRLFLLIDQLQLLVNIKEFLLTKLFKNF